MRGLALEGGERMGKLGILSWAERCVTGDGARHLHTARRFAREAHYVPDIYIVSISDSTHGSISQGYYPSQNQMSGDLILL
jgi:hypothetical protein